MAKKNDGIGDIVRGALAGLAATWAMERVVALLNERTSASGPGRVVEGESALPHPTLHDKPEWLLGLDLSLAGSDDEPVIPWQLGAGAGVAYGILRRRVPAVDAASGLVFGAGLYLAANRRDSPSARAAIPWLAYGGAAELTIRALETVSK